LNTDLSRVRCMTAYSSLNGEERDERVHWSALFGWAGTVEQLFSNEWGRSASSFKMSGCNDPLFHMSLVTKYLVIFYPTGVWELHFRSGKLSCAYKLKCRPKNMLDTAKLGFQ
jgi:hypothetical protein